MAQDVALPEYQDVSPINSVRKSKVSANIQLIDGGNKALCLPDSPFKSNLGKNKMQALRRKAIAVTGNYIGPLLKNPIMSHNLIRKIEKLWTRLSKAGWDEAVQLMDNIRLNRRKVDALGLENVFELDTNCHE